MSSGQRARIMVMWTGSALREVAERCESTLPRVVSGFGPWSWGRAPHSAGVLSGSSYILLRAVSGLEPRSCRDSRPSARGLRGTSSTPL